jgi:TatD DNase family protein
MDREGGNTQQNRKRTFYISKVRQMNSPLAGDYIDIHVHGGRPARGIFILESLMAHEERSADNLSGVAYTYGIHPWFLNENNYREQMTSVENNVGNSAIIAIGEAGFDKLRGPSPELQRKVFEEQVIISETQLKPLIIHCVRAWDELLLVHKKLRPRMRWMVHGFRGSVELAKQLISKGMYLSVWFDFVLRQESSNLMRSLPQDRFFLETDGADVDIRDIYKKVSIDLGVNEGELKAIIHSNFYTFFKIQPFN